MVEEVEEIELDLALSIGGTFGRPTVEKPVPDSKPVTVAAIPPREKREVQALRRIEAKRKREGKRERVREPENDFEQAFKLGKTECQNAVGDGPTVTAPFRMHHFATVQYLPLNSGSPLPCETNVGGGVDDVNGGDGTTNTKSNASSRCSSSVVSDYQSSSLEDGGSTDSHSHSVHSMAEPPHLNTSKEISIGTQKPEGSACASSPPTRPKQDLDTQERNHIAKEPQPQSQSQSQPNPNPNLPSKNNKALATIPIENSSSNPILETKFEVGKIPPKPLSHHTSSSLLQMPYVSTKGHNGKTVNGFLYRYTKSEVSIVCVCHGSTFSPAEFVQHAGGTDISHPLRHITVIPSAYG